jgi:TetR/AcrR family transcriptional repressor of bet genes
MPEETRGRIIAGAYHTLISQGYEATSVKDIAREAGVPPGLIHYYFTSKEDLLVAAIRYGCSQVIPMQEIPSSLTLAEAFTLVKTHLSTHRGFYRLLFEMIGVSFHHEHIAKEMQNFIGEHRAVLEQLVRDVRTARGSSDPAASALTSVIWGAVMGILFQDLLDPAFETEAAIDALTQIVLEEPRR